MPSYSYGGINLWYSTLTPEITVITTPIESQTDVYVTLYLPNVIDYMGGMSWERTPSLTTTGQISATSGTISTFSYLSTGFFPSSTSVDANLYIYKATYTPATNFIGNVSFSIASSNVFSYTWTDVYQILINGQTQTSSYQSRTQTSNISQGDVATVNVDTEFRYELNSSNGIYEVSEGGSLQFVFDTVHLTNPGSLSYRIYKLGSSDSVDGDLDIAASGGLIFTNGSAIINAQLTADNFTEGTETFAIGIFDSQQNQLTFNLFDVLDTSLTPPSTPTLSLQNDTGLLNNDLETSSGVVNLADLVSNGAWEYRLNTTDSWQAGSGSSLTVTGDGTKTVYVRQTDLVGTTSAVSALSFVLDTASNLPTLALQNDTGLLNSDLVTNSGVVTLANLVSNGAWEYRLNTTDAWQAGSGSSLTVTGDGTKTVYVRQTDLAGNTSAVNTLSFVLDTVVNAPTLALQNDTGIFNNDLETSSGVVNLADLVSNGAWEYRLNTTDAWQTGSGSSLTVTGDGTKTAYVRQTDLAGNTSAVSSLSFVVDTTLPSLPTLALQNDTGLLNSDLVTNSGVVTLANLVSNGAWEYRLNTTDAWQTGSGSSLTVTGDGTKTVYVRQTDLAGNTSAANTLSFVLDTTSNLPALALQNDTGIFNNDLVTSSGVVNIANLVSNGAWEYRLNTTDAWQTGSGSSLTMTGDGTKTVYVRQTDLAGNTSAVSSLSLTLDSVAPLSAPFLQQVVNERAQFLDGYVSPNNFVKLTIEDSRTVYTQADSSGYWLLDRLTGSDGELVLGLRTIAVSQLDLAGNESSSIQRTVILQSPSSDSNRVEPNNSIFGTGASETIYGNSGNNSLFGMAGDDVLFGGSGADTLVGGSGDDTLDGGIGSDFLYGGSGDDVYILYQNYAGNDLIDEDFAASTTDAIYWVDSGNSRYVSSAERVGNDLKIYTFYDRALFTTTMVLNQYAGSAIEYVIDSTRSTTYRLHSGTTQTLSGSADNDFIAGSALDNEISGGDGIDSLHGGAGNDTLLGGLGNDILGGGVGNDLLYGDAGDDVFLYTSGSDSFYGGSGTDAIVFGFNRSLIEQVTGNANGYTIGSNGSQLSVTGVESLQFMDGSYTTAEFLSWVNTSLSPPTYAATYAIPVNSILSIGLSPDGQFLLIKTSSDLQKVAIGSSMSFNGIAVTTSDLTQTMTPIPVFKSSGGTGGFTLPELYTGPASLGLKYQLIESARNAVVTGSSDNDFIKVSSEDSIGKAVNGGGGNDVVDGGVGSTFVTGGGSAANSSTYFLDGRAPGTSWSTITDFKAGIDKATIWGFVKGVSSVDTSFTNFNNEGAGGYQGLTLHFKNLLPDGQTSGSNANLNSITLTGRTLQEFGASSLAELNTQINNGANSHFIVGATNDALGTHSYLFMN